MKPTKNLFGIVESVTFLVLIVFILFSLVISNYELISTYEKIVGHSLNEFTVKIILLFKQVALVIAVLIITLALYIKYERNKKSNKTRAQIVF